MAMQRGMHMICCNQATNSVDFNCKKLFQLQKAISTAKSYFNCKKQQRVHMCITPNDQHCNPPEDMSCDTEQVCTMCGTAHHDLHDGHVSHLSCHA